MLVWIADLVVAARQDDAVGAAAVGRDGRHPGRVGPLIDDHVGARQRGPTVAGDRAAQGVRGGRAEVEGRVGGQGDDGRVGIAVAAVPEVAVAGRVGLDADLVVAARQDDAVGAAAVGRDGRHPGRVGPLIDDHVGARQRGPTVAGDRAAQGVRGGRAEVEGRVGGQGDDGGVGIAVAAVPEVAVAGRVGLDADLVVAARQDDAVGAAAVGRDGRHPGRVGPLIDDHVGARQRGPTVAGDRAAQGVRGGRAEVEGRVGGQADDGRVGIAVAAVPEVAVAGRVGLDADLVVAARQDDAVGAAAVGRDDRHPGRVGPLIDDHVGARQRGPTVAGDRAAQGVRGGRAEVEGRVGGQGDEVALA